MTNATDDAVDYHVNYRGPTYLTDVWYLCGAFDNLAEAWASLEARIAADMGQTPEPGTEWRLVAVRAAVIAAVIEHRRLTERGVVSVPHAAA